jgi:hypothetical protein
MEHGLLLRLGAAASVAGHTAVLAGILVFAGVQPFQSASSKPIEVDLVPQQELDRVKAETVQPLPLEIPPRPEPSVMDAAPQPEKQATPAPKPQPAPRAQQPQPAQQAALAPQAAEAPPPQPMPSPAVPAALPPPMAAPQPPDITERFHVMLGLPSDSVVRGGGGQAAEGARIEASDTDKLRAHLRSCASLPGSIGAADKIKIVMRAVLSPDGRLMAPPALIEASASPKGPALMQAAIGALEACQPYSMLPADKYKEWRVLDIPFTPRDFGAG